MARSEARITVDIWAPESDFRELSSDDQWMYFHLISQDDLTHDGVLPLSERRWSRDAAGLTVQDIVDRLARLDAARYIVVDESTEEVLIRSLIRRDKVFKQPNVLRAAADHLARVRSPLIRAALAGELLRIQPLDMPKDSVVIIAEMLESLGVPQARGSEKGSGDPSADGSDIPSAEFSAKDAPGTPGERGGVKVSTPRAKDLPLAPGPEPQISSASAAADDSADTTDEAEFALIATEAVEPAHPHQAPKRAWTETQIYADPHFAAFWTVYPLKVDKPKAAVAWLRQIRDPTVKPEDITKGAMRYRDDPQRPSERRYIKHPPTWLNGRNWTDENAVTPAPRGQSDWWGDN